jgi:8-oxo-dGTP pyrophosphatase MutT (NUDIX family)
MSFEFVIGQKQIPEGYGIVERVAVRAVIYRKQEVLMILTGKGDYKFPGGGVEKGEDIYQALNREILEETGYSVTKIGDVLGHVVQQNIDKLDATKYFIMKSIYLECNIDERNQIEQNLDEYEKVLEFMPKFVPIKEAIENNETLFKQGTGDINPWVSRDTEVLRRIGQMEKYNK